MTLQSKEIGSSSVVSKSKKKRNINADKCNNRYADGNIKRRRNQHPILTTLPNIYFLLARLTLLPIKLSLVLTRSIA